MAILKFKDPATGEEKTIGGNLTKAAIDIKLATLAPKYIYSNQDIEKGVTPLDAGTLYFVYDGPDYSATSDISFTVIGLGIFYATPGMTWEEWGSDETYTKNNTWYGSTNDDGMAYGSSEDYLFIQQGNIFNFVHYDDTIVNGAIYYLTETSPTITFTVQNNSYTVASNITWGQFCSMQQVLNNSDFTYDTDYVYWSESAWIVNSQGEPVKPNEIIQATTYYTETSE